MAVEVRNEAELRAYPFEELTKGWEGRMAGDFHQIIPRFRALLDNPGARWRCTTDGGSPRCGWREVVSVGMAKVWPYENRAARPVVGVIGWDGYQQYHVDNLTELQLGAVERGSF
jgi:hypothetical protein